MYTPGLPRPLEPVEPRPDPEDARVMRQVRMRSDPRNARFIWKEGDGPLPPGAEDDDEE